MNTDAELNGYERREKIYTLLKKANKLSVSEMAALFNVSDMTIRRDFHLMEEQGLLLLHYGGAVLKESHPAFREFEGRKDDFYKYKLEIAKCASGYISEGDTVYLDTSTTILLMMRYIPNVKFTLVTNSVPVILDAYTKSNIELFIAPGRYESSYGGAVDIKTLSYLSAFHYTKSFFGTGFIDTNFGASAPKENESEIKKAVIKNSDFCYLLADHSKFGKKAFAKFADISDFDTIFTDKECDSVYISELNKYTKIVTA